mmetsp:Transcript_37562/g.107968  ORF Transcript_37562/g.107968 Transcript_37562/m.107968 type:complete len:82 (-) Transcript_37562:136-381(-)
MEMRIVDSRRTKTLDLESRQHNGEKSRRHKKQDQQQQRGYCENHSTTIQDGDCNMSMTEKTFAGKNTGITETAKVGVRHIL